MESEPLRSDIKKICRVCLRLDNRARNIFMSHYAERFTLYSDMLAYCTKSSVNEKDGFPPYLCRNCIIVVREIYEFHLKCEESEKNFHWLLSVR